MEGHARPPVVTADAVAQWRAAMSGVLRQQGMTPACARRRVPALETALRWIAGRLDAVHGTPHLGNFSDPTDEFVFIVLSRKTPERAYVPAFKSLKGIGTWEHVLDLDGQRIEKAIRGGGLEAKKARAVASGLRAIRDRFGTADLRLARGLGDDDLFEFLSALPEVGPKSARCVMLYSFGRAVFPVDAHVGRVLARIGCMVPVDIDLGPMGHEARQRALETTIPPDLRYGLHVNLVAHGRTICTAARPLCEDCSLAPRCAYAQARRALGGRTQAR
jgi:endonuclease III